MPASMGVVLDVVLDVVLGVVLCVSGNAGVANSCSSEVWSVLILGTTVSSMLFDS